MLQIRNRQITRDGAPFVMAEIGVNHDGSVEIAAQLIEAAHAAGADAVKFQLFEAERLLAKQAGLVDYQKSSAETADDLLKPLELSAKQMGPLVKQAQSLGLAAVVTPFSPELVSACVEMQVDAIKLASPDLVNLPLLREALATKLPLFVSTGAADMGEVETTVEWISEARGGNGLSCTVILHCVSSYPTPPEAAALGGITALRNRFPSLRIGYSDHTTETYTASMAVAAGACLLEKHLTLDRTRKGPDHAASLEPKQFAEYANCARFCHQMRGPIAKQPQPRELQIRQQTRQSLTTKMALSKGTTLTRDMLTVKRPGTGIPAALYDQTIGRKLVHAVSANTILTPDDLEAQT
ncbi:MAG TPA: N-acetylneuraminate synthase family protein [Phycisphaerae bacterium]|nr:N-acetylneuraminate synthase family protein [Phycisphaerae bacterium]